jgi:hypothetical protein
MHEQHARQDAGWSTSTAAQQGEAFLASVVPLREPVRRHGPLRRQFAGEGREEKVDREACRQARRDLVNCAQE